MPITVSGTQITFNDATTQSTAGITSAVTSLNGQTGAITNTSTNTIGSYIAAGTLASGATYAYGATIAGSSLRCALRTGCNPYYGMSTNISAGSSSTYTNPSVSGTWRVMGYLKNQTTTACDDANGMMIWVRIS